MLQSRIISLLLPVSKRFVPSRIPAVINSSATHCGILQNYESKRHYKRFGHKEKPEALFTKIFCVVCGSLMLLGIVDWRWCRMIYLSATGQIKENDDNKQLDDKVS